MDDLNFESISLNKLKQLNPSSQELEIGQWLIFNKFALKDKINSTKSNLFNKQLNDLMMTHSIDGLMDKLKVEIQETFNNLTPEELNSIITEEFVNNILGVDFLYG